MLEQNLGTHQLEILTEPLPFSGLIFASDSLQSALALNALELSQTRKGFFTFHDFKLIFFVFSGKEGENGCGYFGSQDVCPWEDE